MGCRGAVNTFETDDTIFHDSSYMIFSPPATTIPAFITSRTSSTSMTVLHTAVWVSDLEATVEFYEEVLGLEYSRDFVGSDGVRNYFMAGESGAAIQFKYDENSDVETTPGTMDHLATSVENVDTTVERAVEEWDTDIVDGPRTLEDHDVRIAFITDPNGYTIELVQKLSVLRQASTDG
ncbi:VOC family protein [Natrialba swarupiae]|nr:VOC family protein [Natrialba swarupiae]